MHVRTTDYDDSPARCLADDLDTRAALPYPLRHREWWAATNLLECSLAEVRPRTTVMGRFPARAAASCSVLLNTAQTP
jgi:hypothetical protein